MYIEELLIESSGNARARSARFSNETKKIEVEEKSELERRQEKEKSKIEQLEQGRSIIK